VIAKLSNGVMMGGYAAVGWNPSVGNGGHSNDPSNTSFLFQMPSTQYKVNNGAYSTCYNGSYGPSFGSGGSCLNFTSFSSKAATTWGIRYPAVVHSRATHVLYPLPSWRSLQNKDSIFAFFNFLIFCLS
jgi:hypothetical protein